MRRSQPKDKRRRWRRRGKKEEKYALRARIMWTCSHARRTLAYIGACVPVCVFICAHGGTLAIRQKVSATAKSTSRACTGNAKWRERERERLLDAYSRARAA